MLFIETPFAVIERTRITGKIDMKNVVGKFPSEPGGAVILKNITENEYIYIYAYNMTQ